MVFAAGVCSELPGLEETEMRRYAMALLHGFFKSKGRELEVADYERLLRRTFRHIHGHISEKWAGRDIGLDLAVVVANPQSVFAARSGGGGLFIFHDGEARSVFRAGGGGEALLGTASGDTVEVQEALIQPGDIAVLCDPVVAKVIGERDVTLILRRAPDHSKASLLLSAIAERKGAEGPMTALLWEVPNFQGAAMLTEEQPAAVQPEASGEKDREVVDEDGSAEAAKRQWLSKWRRRRE
ncbi:MAG: hypothetical protein PHP28_01580 [Actinomycetota bacterium]|nr:hypothetical protein [Actinomycetota bacterium]MDD5666105.1 hypothetical protein [Actinomycetota bacterium]